MSAPSLTAEQGLGWLRAWEAAGWLRGLDVALAEFLGEQTGESRGWPLVLAAWVSHQAGRGHVCLDLDALLERPDAVLSLPPERVQRDDDDPPAPSACLHGVTAAELDSALYDSDLIGPAASDTPLVRLGHRLYLRRYHTCEQTIAEALDARMLSRRACEDAFDPTAVRGWMNALFGAPDHDAGPDWQRIACAAALGGAYTVITGGPGTGKTSTVLRLLALLQALQGHGPALRIRLTAPTGKAAARLNDSVAGAVDALLRDVPGADEALRASIPTEVVTLHRLLGARPGTRHFRHNTSHPLPVDVVVVDEASMIDVELMAALMDALPDTARLILLGDRDQLASVEAGAVLGELCRDAEAGRYTPERAEVLSALSGEAIAEAYRDAHGDALAQHAVMLRRSHRFGAESSIARLATAINAGDADASRAVLQADGTDAGEVVVSGPDDPALREWILYGGGVAPGLTDSVRVIHDQAPGVDADRDAFDAWAAAVLDALGACQLLVPVRQGEWGVAAMNVRIAGWLQSEGWLSAEGSWYPGRPVLMTRNDYALGLINGDVGVTLHLPRRLAAAAGEEGVGGAVPRVAFRASDGSGRIRWVPPYRLETVETAYALTVHKAQGSEYDHAALLMPDHSAPVLTQELLYTAVTRARQRFTLLHGDPRVFATAVRQRIHRSGGLRARIDGAGTDAPGPDGG